MKIRQRLASAAGSVVLAVWFVLAAARRADDALADLGGDDS